MKWRKPIALALILGVIGIMGYLMAEDPPYHDCETQGRCHGMFSYYRSFIFGGSSS
jgi:hypothetical protein